MARRKHPRLKRKSKEEKSKLTHCAEEQRCEDSVRINEESVRAPDDADGARRKSAKKVHVAFLPDKYEPLEEEREEKNPHKYKKLRKNIRRALRYSWKCLIVGLQNFSSSYSGPLSAATTLVPEIYRPKA